MSSMRTNAVVKDFAYPDLEEIVFFNQDDFEPMNTHLRIERGFLDVILPEVKKSKDKIISEIEKQKHTFLKIINGEGK